MPFKATLIFAALMVFTYAGYPAVAFLLSRIMSRPLRRASIRPTISVLLPVHDEGPRLAAKVGNVLSQDYPQDRLRLIVVDDGSTDGSVEALCEAAPARVEVVRLANRSGKAAAINAGLAVARGEVIVFTDARQDLAPGALASIVSNFADEGVTAVTGRLASPGGAADGLFRGYVERIRSWEAAWGSCAGATGALYAVRCDCAAAIPPDAILDDLVMSLSAAARGRLAYDARAIAFEADEPFERVWRRRLRTLAGNWQIVLSPLRYRALLAPRVIAPLFCQKMLRLFFPFFACGFAVSLFLAFPAAFICLAGGAWLALAAVAAFRTGLAHRAAESAASLLIAPVEALVLYLSGRQTVLWRRGTPVHPASSLK
jgi:cellulose synthase/poly-beta-1,6-N-acetylglucosamine synthase-like glycosyltransferase